MKTWLTLGLAVLTPLWGRAWERWELADGATAEARILSVSPGVVRWQLRDGREEQIGLDRLTAASRARLAAVLGLAAVPPPALPFARDPSAVDATDQASLEAGLGQRLTVIGRVRRVATLGAAGHRLIEFEDSRFGVFIAKRQLTQAGWNLESLAGRTVQVRGELSRYQDRLQMTLFEPAQIEALP